jgi:hypothetical protein
MRVEPVPKLAWRVRESETNFLFFLFSEQWRHNSYKAIPHAQSANNVGLSELIQIFNSHPSTLAFTLCSLCLIPSSQIPSPPPPPTKGDYPPTYHLFHIILPLLIRVRESGASSKAIMEGA